MKLFARLALPNTNNDVCVSRVGDMGSDWGKEGSWRTHPCDAQRRAPLRLRICVYEIPQPLNLREIKPAALVRAARELARSGEATRWDAPDCG
jgi:hypothetical protein